ncbi:MAG: phospho-N-acetylmuramoyl-pentapeptide-transferase [Deltaproteobacteria bacterium]|jgi:phospho-N-acetylmuramoyl-pentapeptide-transferase|nr:phospho-N-acetylmuramoyl-pentapeptide-transferase [Deltaproteobacteria bacterium]
MFYHLLVPLSEYFTVFNVFRYITFRSVWALLTALLVAIVLGPRFISMLRRLKFGQPILEYVEAHKQKAGTPTMGGLLIAFSLGLSVLLWGNLANPYTWLCLLVFFGFGLVGFADDWMKIRRKNNKGISGKQKLAGQIVVASAAVLLLIACTDYGTEFILPFFKQKEAVLLFNIDPVTQLAFPFVEYRPAPIDIGWFYLPFAVLVLVSCSNGVNLTDGLDGLAIGPTVVAGVCFAIFIYVAGHMNIAGYLQVAFVPGVGEVTVFCGAFIGAGLGFLWFNAYPAQVFMGDVGSLPLGGTLGFMAVLCKQELILLVVGGLFVAESLSVILQVGFFRMSGGKRIFRMAPLHHHFELKGVPESKIIIRFWITAILLGLASLSVLKLR